MQTAPVTKEPVQGGEVIPLHKRHAVHVLRDAGLSTARIAAQTGLDPRAVRRLVHEPLEVGSFDDRAEARRRHLGRPSKVEAFHALVERLLAEDTELPSLELLRRARLDGYAGSKSPFYELVARCRKRARVLVVRFEGLAGEFSQHDFGHVEVRFVDRSRLRVHFFASRLKFSRWVQVTLVPNETAETLARTLLEHFATIGGVPLLAVFDRPRTVVLDHEPLPDGSPRLHRYLQEVLQQLHVGAELCAPRSGNQKGSVENLVGWVKGSFFKCRRFVDLADLQQQLADWHLESNTRRPSRATGVTPLVRMEQERPRLRAVRVQPEDLALHGDAVVLATSMVHWDGCDYSMPPEAIGLNVKLWIYRDRLRLVAAHFEAVHPRLSTPGARSFLPAHRPRIAEAGRGPRALLYGRREQLRALAPEVEALLTTWVHEAPRGWAPRVEHLFGLLVEHGEARLLEAVALLQARGRTDLDTLEQLLTGQLRAAAGSESAPPARRGGRHE